VQPKVLYVFADPALESRSAGQKILMRMGPVNEARVKTKLRDVRRALTAQNPPR
jgi:type II secretory pathway component PulM